jgi:multiple sugar transport system substrate-binding protein
VFNKEDPQEVLASWLFTQYLLTNEVQIAYAQTEGYVPVTSKAQDSAKYQDYLSKAGKDNDLYYDVKLQASQLLLRNTGNTFVTPVFNGSASLRNAAGQLIEDVNKAVRRKKTVDDAFLDALFQDMTALYRLDQITPDGIPHRQLLGPMPKEAWILLGSLGAAWLAILAGAVISGRRKPKNNH